MFANSHFSGTAVQRILQNSCKIYRLMEGPSSLFQLRNALARRCPFVTV